MQLEISCIKVLIVDELGNYRTELLEEADVPLPFITSPPQPHPMPLNVLSEPLQPCSLDPLTGYFRDGSCRTADMDIGTHVICARVTAEFLEFSRKRGNDLSTPRPEHQFPGLQPGDQWCLCALRWVEAFAAGKAPLVVLASTHIRALEFVSLGDLRSYATQSGDVDASRPVDN